MRTIYKPLLIALAFSFLCFSCSKNDDINPSADTANQNVLCGTISSYTAGTIDSLKFCYALDIQHVLLVLGRGTVASDGTFSIKLSTPPDSLLKVRGKTDSGVTYSDITVKECGGEENYGIIAYKNKSIVGGIVYANDVYKTGSTNSKNDGWSFGSLYYYDKNVTITGGNILLVGNYTYNDTYNITAKQGWNMIYRLHNYSKAGSTVSESDKTTTTLPANYKWYYYSLSDIYHNFQ
jgi:hypothetical protein